MAEKLKLTAPLAISIGVIAFLYVEFAANFSFHWVTSGNLGNGLDLPANFHLVLPAAFIPWGMFFVLGANNDALKLVVINTVIGCLSALILFWFVHTVKKAPDFWAISLGVGLLAFILVMATAVSELVNVPTIFTTFAGTIFWWLATGADGWVPGAVGHSVKSLASPATAGSGAFGGVLSTPYGFVVLNVFVTMLIGTACAVASARLAAVLTPKSAAAAATVDAEAEGARPRPA